MGLAVSLMLFATVERRIVQSGAIVKQLAGKPHWSRHHNVLSAFVAISTEARSKSLAATQEPDRKAVLKPAADESLALRPSHSSGMTTKPGSARGACERAGGAMACRS